MSMGRLDSDLEDLYRRRHGAFQVMVASVTGSVESGRRIAFRFTRAVNSDVYVVNANGIGQRRLTTNAAYDVDPVWSADGRQIAFLSERDGNLRDLRRERRRQRPAQADAQRGRREPARLVPDAEDVAPVLIAVVTCYQSVTGCGWR